MSALVFHHHAILVSDLSRAESFYRDVLGLEVTKRWTDDNGEARSIWLALGDATFLAIERASTHALGSERGHHCFALAIASSERSTWLRRLEDAQVAIEKSTDFSLYVRDPEGNQIALSHWPVAAKHPTDT